jgi:hypothetical protein
MSDQFDSLAPRDILITLRSIRRRIDGVVGQVRSDPVLFSQIDAPNAAGMSFGEILNSGAQSTGHLARALAVAATATRKNSAPEFDPESGAERLSIETAQDLLASDTTSLADSLEGLEADVWSANIAVAGSGDLSVVHLSREVARRAIGTLRELQTRVDEMSD